MKDDVRAYEDILRLPHHQSAAHPRMSMQNRAAQFNPYAALVGFDGVIAETGRLTDRRIELSEMEKERLGRKLAWIDGAVRAGQHPELTVRFFVPDARKEGGSYQEWTGRVRSVDPVEKTVVFLAENGRSRGKAVPMADITEVRGDPVDGLELE